MAETSRLPHPSTDAWDWQLRGHCRGQDTSLFFHPENERGGARAAREARAKTICQTCPVINECRDHALAVEEPYGVWGGMGEDERRAIIAARKKR